MKRVHFVNGCGFIPFNFLQILHNFEKHIKLLFLFLFMSMMPWFDLVSLIMYHRNFLIRISSLLVAFLIISSVSPSSSIVSLSLSILNKYILNDHLGLTYFRHRIRNLFGSWEIKRLSFGRFSISDVINSCKGSR